VLLEDDVVDRFIDKFCYSGGDQMHVPQKRTYDTREMLDHEIAAPGEQVAAKVMNSKSEEDSTWILGNVLQYDFKTHTYIVQDEDDVNRIMQLPFAFVKRLGDTAQHLRRGDRVVAVFPETTSFYRAVVAKNPKGPSPNATNQMWEVVVKFDDDEDESGKNPARRVPARFVLRRSEVEGEGTAGADGEDNESTQS